MTVLAIFTTHLSMEISITLRLPPKKNLNELRTPLPFSHDVPLYPVRKLSLLVLVLTIVFDKLYLDAKNGRQKTLQH